MVELINGEVIRINSLTNIIYEGKIFIGTFGKSLIYTTPIGGQMITLTHGH